jgi:dipeptide/tripeptide permease
MNTAAERETSRDSLIVQLAQLDRVYWIANAMEMIERLAYYGLRTVLPLYMVLSVQQGGPEFDHVQKGQILAIWAAVQSFLPVFTGGYADRYGYKLTVAVAIAVKVAGYVVMGFAIPIAAALAGGAIVEPGDPAVYYVFLGGAVLLAAGTAIFKPGLQGIIAVRLTESNASVGWSMFYQLVNVGGFLGPFLASSMRLLEWRYVFISCAVVVCLNYVLLLTFAEPEKGATSDHDRDRPWYRVLWDSVIGICEPRLLAFLVIFSGFWMMFFQLFDLLPNFISDWVDTSAVAAAVFEPIWGLFGEVPEAWGGQVPPEQIVNINAFLIMFFAFIVGFFTGKVRSMNAMIVGIAISAVAIAMFAISWSGWWVVLAIAVFSLGEMAASPTKMRYIAGIAPPGRKALYLGYVNATVGIGWSIGSLVAGAMYQQGGDKVMLARRHLIDGLGMDPTTVDTLPKDDVLPALAQAVGLQDLDAQHLLWSTYHPERIWLWFALVGIVSMIGLVAFDRITRLNLRNEFLALGALMAVVSVVTYGWRWALVFASAMAVWVVLERVRPSALPIERDIG